MPRTIPIISNTNGTKQRDGPDLDEGCGPALAGIRHVVQPVRLLTRVMREAPELAGDDGARFELVGLFLAVLHHPSLALAGAVVCAMFGAGVAAQFLTEAWSVTRDLEAGMGAMVIGVGLAVLAVWLRSPSLALFIAGGALIGGGSGAIFKGAVGTIMSISPPGRIAESLTGAFLSAYVGISLPVVGAGITLAHHVTPKVTVLGFAIAISGGIAASAIKLLGRTTAPAPAAPTVVGGVAEARAGKSNRELTLGVKSLTSPEHVARNR